MGYSSVGIIGTRHGLTPQQQSTLYNFFERNIFSLKEAHHGDEIGTDLVFHKIAKSFGLKIIIHPPDSPLKRAFLKGSEILEEKSYEERDKEIIDFVDLVIIAPSDISMKKPNAFNLNNAILYAKKIKKPIMMLYPDGKITILAMKEIHSGYSV